MSKLSRVLGLTLALTVFGLPSIVENEIKFDGILTSYAAETWESGNTIVEFDNGILTVKAKDGTDGKMADHYEVSSLNNPPPWRSVGANLKSIVVEEGVTYIGHGAFSKLLNTSGFTAEIPESVTEIGGSVFAHSTTSEVNIRGSEVLVGTNVFQYTYSEAGNISPAVAVTVNVYGNLTYRGNIAQYYGNTTQRRNGTIVFHEGVEDVGFHGFANTVLPTTTKRIVYSTGNSSLKTTFTANGPMELEYIISNAWAGAGMKSASVQENIKVSENCTYLGTYSAGLIKYDITLNSITELQPYTFNGYEGNVVINSAVEDIPANTFNGMVGTITMQWDKIKTVGASAFANVTGDNKFEVDLSSVESVGSLAFNGSNAIEKLVVGGGAKTYDSFNNMKGLKELIILPEDTQSYYQLSGNTALSKVYWLGSMQSSMSASYLPTTAHVYCTAGSTVETWCKNNSRAYTLLSDEEVDEIVNGKTPFVVRDTKLFDHEDKDALSFDFSLGEGALKASSVSKVIVGNKTISSDDYIISGNTVTISIDYLSKLADGDYAVSLQFNNSIKTLSSGASIKVVNSKVNQGGEGSKPPEALVTITYEFYKDYPDYVIIPVVLNGATDITELKIGTEVVSSSYYEIADGALILDKAYLLTLDAGKYRVLPKFNDVNETLISNIQLLVYDEAADRAAPYLLQSRIIFTGQNVVMNFDTGYGDLAATNVLALVIDNTIVLPNGNTVPFSSSNVRTVKNTFLMENDYIPDEDEIITSPSNASPSNASPSNASRRSVLRSAYTFSVEDYSKVFNVDGTIITLSGDYVESMNLSEGDHLIGAIFDNTEKTTDIKKVILTIEKETEEPENPDPNPGNPEEPENPDPDPEEPEAPTPEEPDPEVPTPEDPDPEVPTKPGSNGGGGGGGSFTKPSKPTPTDKLPDGSINPDYKPGVPDSGGSWESDDNGWYYVLPDGEIPKGQWVGDGGYWYYVDGEGYLLYDWFKDANGKWYMLNRDKDNNFGRMLTGWYYEKQDGKWYFLNPSNGEMLVGWQFIGGQYYFLTEYNDGPTYFGNNTDGWKYKEGDKPYGSMYCGELTPDDYTVDGSGKWVK